MAYIKFLMESKEAKCRKMNVAIRTYRTNFYVLKIPLHHYNDCRRSDKGQGMW